MTEEPVEITEERSLGEEIADLQRRREQYDSMAFDLQKEYDGLTAKGKDAEADKVHVRLMAAINGGTALSQKIADLRHPSELERRVEKRLATKRRIGALRERSTTMAKETPKDQGFPTEYLNENGKFRIGMDARAKSDLVASALGLVTKTEPGKALHVFTPAEAEKLLKARGWTGFLERKRELVKSEADAKARRETERAEAAKTKAAEKEKAAADKKAAKANGAADAESATAAKGTGTQVKADPKPSSKKKAGRSSK